MEVRICEEVIWVVFSLAIYGADTINCMYLKCTIYKYNT